MGFLVEFFQCDNSVDIIVVKPIDGEQCIRKLN